MRGIRIHGRDIEEYDGARKPDIPLVISLEIR
jgi:hypothetical protein